MKDPHHVQHPIFPFRDLPHPLPFHHVHRRPLAFFLNTQNTLSLLPYSLSFVNDEEAEGFRIGRKVLGVWSWIVKPKQRSPSGFIRLNHEDGIKPKTTTKICSWGHCLTKRLCFSRRRSSDYSHVGQTSFDAKPVAVPKGHLAVYVGQKDNDPHRFLVPVIYFNHPLFGELLRQAEREYGFNHTGGINLPCQISEFESVQMMIATEERRRKVTRKRRSLLGGF